MADVGDLVFVLGAHKTGTSTAVALLNSRPDILVLYEVDLGAPMPSKYGRQLIAARPDLLPFFGAAPRIETNYLGLLAQLRAEGQRYRYLGDKMPGLRRQWLNDYRASRIVYCVRDIRDWLVKDSVRHFYFTDGDVVPAALAYMTHFLESFHLPRVLHLRFDLLLSGRAPALVSHFLGIPNTMEEWWRTAGRYRGLKASVVWWRGHPSSLIEPRDNDTTYELRDCDFWRQVLPVFDKYYRDGAQGFSSEEIGHDLQRLRAGLLGRRWSLRECYERHSSQSLCGPPTRPASLFKRLGALGRRLPFG